MAVPAVAGQSQDEAVAILNAAGFANVSVVGENSDSVPAGVVISIDPAAGELIQTANQITIVVSTGPAPTPEPTQAPQQPAAPTPTPQPGVDPNNAVTAYSYTGVPEAQAVAAAQADGLTVKVEYGTSEKVAPGEVYEQSIAPNTLVNRGTEIVFHINGKAEAQAAPAT